jgi:hypothetical protein
VFTCPTRDQIMLWCARRDLDVFGELAVAGDRAMMCPVQPDDLSQQMTRWVRSEKNVAGSDPPASG